MLPCQTLAYLCYICQVPDRKAFPGGEDKKDLSERKKEGKMVKLFGMEGKEWRRIKKERQRQNIGKGNLFKKKSMNNSEDSKKKETKKTENKEAEAKRMMKNQRKEIEKKKKRKEIKRKGKEKKTENIKEWRESGEKRNNQKTRKGWRKIDFKISLD